MTQACPFLPWHWRSPLLSTSLCLWLAGKKGGEEKKGGEKRAKDYLRSSRRGGGALQPAPPVAVASPREVVLASLQQGQQQDYWRQRGSAQVQKKAEAAPLQRSGPRTAAEAAAAAAAQTVALSFPSLLLARTIPEPEDGGRCLSLGWRGCCPPGGGCWGFWRLPPPLTLSLPWEALAWLSIPPPVVQGLLGALRLGRRDGWAGRGRWEWRLGWDREWQI